jgi:hypothetical protein
METVEGQKSVNMAVTPLVSPVRAVRFAIEPGVLCPAHA